MSETEQDGSPRGVKLATREGVPVKAILMDADGEYLQLTDRPEPGYYVYENEETGVTLMLAGDNDV